MKPGFMGTNQKQTAIISIEVTKFIETEESMPNLDHHDINADLLFSMKGVIHKKFFPQVR